MQEKQGNNKVYCEGCRLLNIACICQYRPNIASSVEFCLLTHATEHRKPTNTGRLIADCLTSTRIYTWSRTGIDPDLKRDLANPSYYHWLVYPAEKTDQADRVRSFDVPMSDIGQAVDKKHVFILLDATWQQAVKMFRKSPYLNRLPILSLSPARLSQYHLRRASQANHLCTAEVAIELLGLADEKENALLLEDYFQVFSQHYLAARSGHGIKTESEQMRRLTKGYHHEIN